MRGILHKVLGYVSIVAMCSLASCSKESIADIGHVQTNSKGIVFGISEDSAPWDADTFASLQRNGAKLKSMSLDATFDASVTTSPKPSPLNLNTTRGSQANADETLTEFDVAAYHHDEGASAATLFFTESVTDGRNTVGKQYFWPMDGTLDFLAITPQGAIGAMPSAEAYNSGECFDYVIDGDVANQQDLMVASATDLNNHSTGSPVTLHFRHLLASIRFLVGDMQFIKITTLEIRNVWGGTTTFSFDKATQTWANSTPTTKQTFAPDFVDTSGLPKGEEIAGNSNNATMFMAPQTLPAEAEIYVEYITLLTGEQHSGVVSLGGHSWEAGKDYAYTFNIGTSFDVTIPSPEDMDAHYIMAEMPYQLGAISDYVTSIKATASFHNDGSNTSSKSGISLKFKEDLSQTQKWGLWTDARFVETITVETNGESSSSGVTKESDIRGESELLIDNLSGSIVLFVEENNGTTLRNGELIFTATLTSGEDIVIGRGNFKQLCPSWNDNGLGVERIEDEGLSHPYGFDYSRTVVYTNPGNNTSISWLKSFFCALYSWGADSYITDDEGDFITLEYKTSGWFSYINTITLDYSALNELSDIATHNDGLENTRALYNYTGSADFSNTESTLDENLGWSKSETASEDIPVDYAAHIALTRNRMYEMKTIVQGNSSTETTYKAILYKDSNDNDIIEWYLPSSVEAQTLKESGTSAAGISPLNGTYWSSTAGDDSQAFASSYTYYNNTFYSINANASRMTNYKVRAVRKKDN